MRTKLLWILEVGSDLYLQLSIRKLYTYYVYNPRQDMWKNVQKQNKSYLPFSSIEFYI